MMCLRLRPSGAMAKVCLWLGMLGCLALSRRAGAQPLALSEAGEQPGVVVYPAEPPGPRRVTVVLHGMCSEPVNACRHFAAQVTKDEHLVCPRAGRRCDGGGSIWPHVGFAEHVERKIWNRAAVFLRQVHAQQPELPGAVPDLAVDVLLRLPRIAMRDHFLGEEASRGLAEVLVL